MNEFYNEAIKNKYLESVDNEGTKNLIRYLFYKSKGVEENLQMDMYNFSIDHIKEVMKNINTKAIETSQSNLSFIRTYINWCIIHGYRENNINPLDGIDSEWHKQFVNENIKQFLSKQEIDEIISNLVNYQDKVIIKLLFEGVYGYESSELRNLKLSNIYANGKSTLHDDKKGKRPFKFDEETIELIKKANDEQRYRNKNGQSLGKAPTSELLPSAYVLKNANKSRSIDNERISQPVLMKRVKMISEVFELPDITPKSIWRSGQLYKAYLSYINTGKINYDEIGERFALSKVVNNGYEYYNVSYLEKNYLNMDTISVLYDIVK